MLKVIDALWQLATNAEALAPQWLHNRATPIATRYEDAEPPQSSEQMS